MKRVCSAGLCKTKTGYKFLENNSFHRAKQKICSSYTFRLWTKTAANTRLLWGLNKGHTQVISTPGLTQEWLRVLRACHHRSAYFPSPHAFLLPPHAERCHPDSGCFANWTLKSCHRQASEAELRALPGAWHTTPALGPWLTLTPRARVPRAWPNRVKIQPIFHWARTPPRGLLLSSRWAYGTHYFYSDKRCLSYTPSLFLVKYSQFPVRCMSQRMVRVYKVCTFFLQKVINA